ncbi:hypothetical protein GY45DRAFT_1360960 [Cubamyces sp. BRFM 1775]|nr:hypothetical protein GY45DRAFT_1360960 [Cubamyces sp. BRFM 1775]
MAGTPGPSSERKKPTCHTCGHPMAGHKRPNGSPVCPRDSASPARSLSQTPSAFSNSPSVSPERETVGRLMSPQSLLQRISPSNVRYSEGPTLSERSSHEDSRFSPTPSGYLHRRNPNWVEPEHYARMPAHQVPQRGETIASWYSTELDEPDEPVAGPSGLHRYGSWSGFSEEPEGSEVSQSPSVEEVYPDDVSAGSQDTVSPPPSQFTRMSRQISQVLSRASTPLATIYAVSKEKAPAVERAARKYNMPTRRIRHRKTVKAEPSSPGNRLGDGDAASSEGSLRVIVARNSAAADEVAARYGAPARMASREPYDYDAGLVQELNERVGTYPVNPYMIRPNFCDVIIAAVVSAFCAVYFLSAM